MGDVIDSVKDIAFNVGHAKAIIEQQRERIAFLEKQNTQLVEALTKSPQVAIAEIIAAAINAADTGNMIEGGPVEPRRKSRWQERIEQIQEEQRAAREKRTPEKP